MALNKNLAGIVRVVLYAAYAGAALIVAWGTYREGWFQSNTPSGNFCADALIGLLIATMLAERTGVFARTAGWREGVKTGACWGAAVLWMVLTARAVPNTSAGMTIMIAPGCTLLLAGLFYVARLGGARMRTRVSLFAQSREVTPASPLAPGASPEMGLLGAASGGIEIAANRPMILLRFVLATAVTAGMGWVMYRLPYGRLLGIVMILAIAFLLGQALWTLTGGDPALSLGPNGLSIQRGLCGVRRLPWAEITSFELRAFSFYAFLVVHVRNPEALIAGQGPYARWVMSQSQRTFGSPVRIPAGWLKCDRNWLLFQANQMLAVYGESQSTTSLAASPAA